MENLPNTTAKVLQAHIDDILKQLNDLELKKTKLISDKEKAELALSLIQPKRRRAIRYDKDATLKQKAIYCLRLKRKILSTSDMLNILFEVDPDLKKDEKNTDNSLRLSIFRLVKENELISYKTDEMKTIHYALSNWTNEYGEIKDEYIL